MTHLVTTAPAIGEGRTPPADRVLTALRYLAGIPVGAVAAAACYLHTSEVARDAGEGALAAWLPLSVEGVIVLATLTVVEQRRSGLAVAWVTWVALALGFIASLAANVLAADPGWVSVAVSVTPSVALPLAVHMLLPAVVPIAAPEPAEDVQPSDADLSAIAEAGGVPVAREDDRTYLYRLYDLAGGLLYVGITQNVETRLAAHRGAKPWWGEVGETAIRAYPNRAQALAVEQHVIESDSPRYNIAPGSLTDTACYRPAVPPEQLAEVAALLADGYGRPTIRDRIGCTDHYAKQLIEQARPLVATNATNGEVRP